VTNQPIQNPRAREIVESLFPLTGERRLQQMERYDPEYRRFLEDFVFGGLYARDVLDQKTRELCALAALTVLARSQQIRSHVFASLNAGATRKEVQEVIMQAAVYGGLPVALVGLEVMDQAYRELDES
jgi:4-carboxymuconolactone decarboxylase